MNIKITSKAIEKLKVLLEENKSSTAKIRIFLAGIG